MVELDTHPAVLLLHWSYKWYQVQSRSRSVQEESMKNAQGKWRFLFGDMYVESKGESNAEAWEGKKGEGGCFYFWEEGRLETASKWQEGDIEDRREVVSKESSGRRAGTSDKGHVQGGDVWGWWGQPWKEIGDTVPLRWKWRRAKGRD